MWICFSFTGLHLTYRRNLFMSSGQRWKHLLKVEKQRVLVSLVSILSYFGIYFLTPKFHQLLIRLSLTRNVFNLNSFVSVSKRISDLLLSHLLDIQGKRLEVITDNTPPRHGQILDKITISIILQENIIRVNHRLC